MGKKGDEGILKRLHHVELWLFALVFISLPLGFFFFGFYAMTRDYVYTYFFTPATYGVLTTNWYKVWDWWKTAMFTLIWPMPAFVMAEIIFFKVFWIKVVFLVYLVLNEFWWITVVVVDIVLMASDPNDPTVSTTNPARSFKACCAPEWYLTVPKCPNYGAANPLCYFPIYSIKELGFNWVFVVTFIMECIVMGIWGVFIYLVIEHMLAVREFFEKGGDQYFLVPKNGYGTEVRAPPGYLSTAPSAPPASSVVVTTTTTTNAPMTGPVQRKTFSSTGV